MLTRSTGALLALGLLAGAAQAHATLEQSEAAIGATTKITLRVPHGCEGEATEAVRIEIPEGFYAVKPMPKAGWVLETETGPYATPYDNHGTEMAEGVRAVTWRGGDLPDAFYDEFTLRGAVGPQMEAGAVMFFPAVQTCANGTVEWTDTSGAEGVAGPAPGVRLVAGDGGHGRASEKAVLGALEITAPAAAATLPNQPVAGGFMTITNTGTQGDVLIGARSSMAGRVEVHEMAMERDVMKMRALPGGLPIPAGETVVLEPGGFHLMFTELSGPLVAGEVAEVTLVFETAGELRLRFPVKPRGEIGGGGHGGRGAHAGHGGN
ncbi:DUF1775 domain-containing protein [Oceanicola sp. 502str15]|uniref:DUF1775 domain-containing protein n=1 Tax=Oceanicola sp. 502str15 TaxID=2696061 RepID=UPI0020964F42|nr:DUF1775 domain-containing protein [Oceanicola sp. 502str15]